MRVAVLGEPTGWHVGKLLAAFCERGHDVAAVRWSELAAEVTGGGAELFFPTAIEQAELIVVRGMPGGRLEDLIFRMDLLGRLALRGTPVVNAPQSLEGAIDKYLSLARLAAVGIPVPRTIVAQDATSIQRAWLSLGGDCIVKPLFGSRGRGMERLRTPEAIAPLLEAAAEAQPSGAVAYLQEYVPHAGWDLRILLIGNRFFSIKRISENGDWRTNLARGARAEAFSPPSAWLDLARRCAAVLQTEIAGVDLLPTLDGRLLVLEVNAVPGWRGLEAAVGDDIAASVVHYLEGRLATPPVFAIKTG